MSCLVCISFHFSQYYPLNSLLSYRALWCHLYCKLSSPIPVSLALILFCCFALPSFFFFFFPLETDIWCLFLCSHWRSMSSQSWELNLACFIQDSLDSPSYPPLKAEHLSHLLHSLLLSCSFVFLFISCVIYIVLPMFISCISTGL